MAARRLFRLQFIHTPLKPLDHGIHFSNLFARSALLGELASDCPSNTAGVRIRTHFEYQS